MVIFCVELLSACTA